MSLGIEIENIPFALASRYGDDPLRFDQTLQGGVLGRPEQGRKPHVVLVSDGALFRIGEPEWVSLFQLDLVGLLEKEVIRQVDLIIRKVPSAPSDAFQTDQLPGRVSTKSHQASTLEVMAMVELAYFGQFSAADTTAELATLHDLVGLVEAHPPEHGVAGHDHGCSARLEVVIQPVVSAGGPILAVPVHQDRFISLQDLRIAVEVTIRDDVVLVSMFVEPEMQKALAPEKVAVSLERGVGLVRSTGRPRYFQSHLVGGLPVTVITVETVLGRSGVAVAQSTRAHVDQTFAVIYGKRDRVVSQPGIG